MLAHEVVSSPAPFPSPAVPTVSGQGLQRTLTPVLVQWDVRLAIAQVHVLALPSHAATSARSQRLKLFHSSFQERI